MQKRYAVQVKWALEQTEAALAPLAAKAMGIAPGQIEAVEITKQSIDARKGGVCFQVALAVSVRRGVKARPDWKPIEEKRRRRLRWAQNGCRIAPLSSARGLVGCLRL